MVKSGLSVGLMVIVLASGCQVKTEVKTSGTGGWVGATAGPVGASTPRESLVEKDIALQEEAARVLSTVMDQTTLDKIKPKLKELTDKHQVYKIELQKLGNTTYQEMTAIRDKFGTPSKVAKGNLAREMTRVNSTIPGGNQIYVQLLDLLRGL